MIVHFTTVHPRTDTRIRIKEVATLARVWPGEVALFVQDGKGIEVAPECGYFIHDTGAPPRGRFRRMTIGAWRMYRAVRKARPRVAHFHDPELLPWAILLRVLGIQIVFDMHEDIPRQLLHKDWVHPLAARVASWIYILFELSAKRWLDAIVIVVPALRERLDSKNVILIANFPSLSEFPATPEAKRERMAGRFVYVGGIVGVRGVREMVEAIGLVRDDRVQLNLLGAFNDEQLEVQMRALDGWRRVQFLGWSDRKTVVAELSKASAGLVLLHPTPQYVISYPVKMFEYMAAGLPVIASDFPLWREIVEGAGCGLLVDPLDPVAIAEAMQWIIDHPEEAAEMGRRGRVAVERTYNWEAESSKLIDLYHRLLPAA